MAAEQLQNILNPKKNYNSMWIFELSNNSAFDSFNCQKRFCITFEKSNKLNNFKSNKPQINPKTQIYILLKSS